MAGRMPEVLTSGLYVLTAKDGEKANGCIVNTAVCYAKEPDRISVTVEKEGCTAGMIQKSGAFCLSVIDTSAKADLFSRFGFQSGKHTDKFAGWERSAYIAAENGIYVIKKGCSAYAAVSVEHTADLGTHLLFAGSVTHSGDFFGKEPMTLAYYMANVAGKIGEEKKSGKVWVCEVCGYAYDESKNAVPFEYLPDAWVCPVCRHGKDRFKLQTA